MAGLEEQIWAGLVSALDARTPEWRNEVGKLLVTDKLERRRNNETFGDDEVFEALLLALLSSNVAWTTVQKVRPKLRAMMLDYDWHRFSQLDDTNILELYNQFRTDAAGSQNLRRMLGYFRDTARSLVEHQSHHGKVDAYFTHLFNMHRSADELALALGSSRGYKLRGFGVPLAAEALRNLGYNLAKPDRHILRAVGIWEMVKFEKWPDKSKHKAPMASVHELRLTMDAIHRLAAVSNRSTSETDTTIWYACARQGAHFTNDELRLIVNTGIVPK